MKPFCPFTTLPSRKSRRLLRGCLFFASALLVLLALPGEHVYAAVEAQLTPSAAAPQPVGTTVVWTTSATDTNAGALHYQYSVQPPGGVFNVVRDFSNAVTYVPADGSFLVSVRHQDWVIKVDYGYGSGTGAVLWRLGKDGDFTIDSDDPYPWFSHQHDAEFEDDGAQTLPRACWFSSLTATAPLRACPPSIKHRVDTSAPAVSEKGLCEDCANPCARNT